MPICSNNIGLVHIITPGLINQENIILILFNFNL